MCSVQHSTGSFPVAPTTHTEPHANDQRDQRPADNETNRAELVNQRPTTFIRGTNETCSCVESGYS